LGIADELRLPSITVYHAAFLIFPDSALTFGGGAYAIHGIIGCPIIKELPQFILTEQQLLVPRRAKEPSKTPNLYLDMLKPVFYLTYQGEELPFTFDSGAQETLLSEVFYRRYRTSAMAGAIQGKQEVGGVGGTSTSGSVVEKQRLTDSFTATPRESRPRSHCGRGLLWQSGPRPHPAISLPPTGLSQGILPV
jgi:hypothetical protein